MKYNDFVFEMMSKMSLQLTSVERHTGYICNLLENNAVCV